MGRDGTGQGGMGWDGMGCNGVGWDGTSWDGMEQDGMGKEGFNTKDKTNGGDEEAVERERRLPQHQRHHVVENTTYPAPVSIST